MQKGTITVSTANSMELVNITAGIEKEIAKSKITDGLCYLYNPHTTAGLTINEGADPSVQTDIIKALKKIIPFGLDYQHLEGNSPSHVHGFPVRFIRYHLCGKQQIAARDLAEDFFLRV